MKNGAPELANGRPGGDAAVQPADPEPVPRFVASPAAPAVAYQPCEPGAGSWLSLLPSRIAGRSTQR